MLTAGGSLPGVGAESGPQQPSVLVIRGERAGMHLLELPVTVAEQRPPRSSILVRVPGAALSLLRLYVTLRRDDAGPRAGASGKPSTCSSVMDHAV